MNITSKILYIQPKNFKLNETGALNSADSHYLTIKNSYG